MFVCIIRDDLWATGETPEEAKENIGLELEGRSWEVWEMAEGQTEPVLTERKYGPPKIKIGQFVRKVEGERVFSD